MTQDDPLPHTTDAVGAISEVWLANDHYQLVVHFRSEPSTTTDQWVAVRTFQWKRPNPPEPQSRRRMLRHHAIATWTSMVQRGWRRCRPPVR